MDKYEIKECPKCGFPGPVKVLESLGTTEKDYICPKCHYRWQS